MAAGVGFVLGLVALVFLHHATAQTVHDVGGTTGWTVPPSGGPAFYSDWAANKIFRVGDSLRFNFQTNNHDVFEVSKESFDSCTFNPTDDDIIRAGPATVTLNDTEMHYFVCTVGPHCSLGQKLSINVVSAAAGGPISPSSPAPPSTVLPPPSPSSSNSLSATLYLSFSAILMTFF
ncbi:cucumber peeling cupredoxin-like [Benincasa hispida]|uniref:cucumber peeling cupredoxin-like n=1 Tax=Benincasa hispida TaxID=102211 RepID=UPI0019029E2F|nr:cucumber peeling cupredoxin-like [Benincasa hispida]